MRAMAFGTFDNFHPGHLSYLSQAGSFAEELIVIVARDQNVLKIKNHLPQENEDIRRQKVENVLKESAINSQVILGDLVDRWQALKKYRPDFICLGYDQYVDLKTLQEFIARERFFCEIKRLEPYYPEKYKSSLFRFK
jgi:FAD synthetase